MATEVFTQEKPGLCAVLTLFLWGKKKNLSKKKTYIFSKEHGAGKSFAAGPKIFTRTTLFKLFEFCRIQMQTTFASTWRFCTETAANLEKISCMSPFKKPLKKSKNLPINEPKMTTIRGTGFGFQDIRRENERKPVSRTSKVHTFARRSKRTNISVNQPPSLISQLFLRLHTHTQTELRMWLFFCLLKVNCWLS